MFCCSTTVVGSRRTNCQECCPAEVRLVPLKMQPSIVFESIVMLPSPCDVTVTVETLEKDDQIQSCHHMAALRNADGSFSWAEAVRFEVKTATAMVIKVQVTARRTCWIPWFS